jgi:prepilin-type processing-associated H-X9-DG protein
VNKLSIYLCPSSPIDKMETAAPHNAVTTETVNGQIPYTIHYYGVMGPKGPNPLTPGVDYPVQTSAQKLNTPANLNLSGGFAATGVFQREQPTRLTDITDGTSNTLMVGEGSWTNTVTGTRYRTWIRGCDRFAACGNSRNISAGINTPSIALFNDVAMGSQHSGGANFGMADGSVRFLQQSITINNYRALASRNGGEVVSE